MTISRRTFICSTGSALAASGVSSVIIPGLADQTISSNLDQVHQQTITPHSFSVIPVVSDGKWIWKDPPQDQTGYLEPREFDVTVGIEVQGRGAGREIVATTVAPLDYAEQQIKDLRLETDGCSATVEPIDVGAAQFILSAPGIAAGQMISANAHYRLQIAKSYFGYEKDQFPDPQKPSAFPKRYTKNSPGINLSDHSVKELLDSLVTESMHAWDKAERFYHWVWENIKGVPGKYTSVEEAIKNKQGDCEERACVFIALCRAAKIPARQVWVPSHVWAEIGLHDHDGMLHWIPIHTAAYSWFGWTGAHELVLQKGDHIRLAARKRTVRLIDDWYRMKGVRAKFNFVTTVTPVAAEGQDPGPGAREKMPDGQWRLVGSHPAKRFMRNG